MLPSVFTAGREGFGVSVVPSEALLKLTVDALSAVPVDALCEVSGPSLFAVLVDVLSDVPPEALITDRATAIISKAASNSFFILSWSG
jgi:hypothetical protein